MLIGTVDIETTGRDKNIHGIHQIGLIIENETEVLFRKEWNVRPLVGTQIDPKALTMGGITREQILAYPDSFYVFTELKSVLESYADPNERSSRLFVSGFNCEIFDLPFLELWWNRHNSVVGIWDFFWRGSMDVFILCSNELRSIRSEFSSFSLTSISKYFNITVDKTQLHSALYDAEITRLIRKKLHNETAFVKST